MAITLLAGSFIIIISSLVVMSEIIVGEVEKETIYDLILAPYSLVCFLTIRMIMKNLLNILRLAFLILIASTILKEIAIFKYIYFLIFLFLGSWSLYGVGLAMASVSLVSKEFKILSNIFRIILIYSLVKLETNILVPFSYAKKILFDITLSQSFLLSNYSLDFFIKFLINSIGYFIIGVLCFKNFEHRFITGNFLYNLDILKIKKRGD